MSIDKNIPIPDVSMARPFEFPFSEMEVGDSLFHPDERSGCNDMRREAVRYGRPLCHSVRGYLSRWSILERANARAVGLLRHGMARYRTVK